jgi:hypothetical protein
MIWNLQAAKVAAVQVYRGRRIGGIAKKSAAKPRKTPPKKMDDAEIAWRQEDAARRWEWNGGEERQMFNPLKRRVRAAMRRNGGWGV